MEGVIIVMSAPCKTFSGGLSAWHCILLERSFLHCAFYSMGMRAVETKNLRLAFKTDLTSLQLNLQLRLS